MKVVKKILLGLLIFLSTTLIISSIWAVGEFDNLNVEEIVFHLQVPMRGANTSYFVDYFKNAFLPIIAITIIVSLVFLRNYKKVFDFKLEIKKLKRSINLNFVQSPAFYVLIYFVISIFFSFKKMDLFTYINNQLRSSTFIEEHYIDPNDVAITFPEEKRNLIYIYLESMESSFTDYDHGGIEYESLIPNLTNIAEENLNFSDNDLLGGAYSTPGGFWTIAAMVSQSAGIPLKLPIDGNTYSGYEKFLPGVTNLGDILEANGYNQKIMFGSDATFAGRDAFFKSHGNYEIYDYYTAIEEGKITEKDYVWWGFDDNNLYEWAKDEILELAEKSEPFNFTLLTVDTHAPEGYLSEDCDEKYESNYVNSIVCADEKINRFFAWLKRQSFYEDTTIIITGDHLTMDNYYISDDDSLDRAVYNAFINSSASTDNYKNREFLLYDMFPTTLASLGVEIEGNRLGLGTNLFSDEETLTEQYGYDHLFVEIHKKSKFYDKTFLYRK